MTEIVAVVIGLFTGVVIGLCIAAPAAVAGRADAESEIAFLRASLAHLGRSSREPAVRRYVARVLDPTGDEAGA